MSPTKFIQGQLQCFRLMFSINKVAILILRRGTVADKKTDLPYCDFCNLKLENIMEARFQPKWVLHTKPTPMLFMSTIRNQILIGMFKIWNPYPYPQEICNLECILQVAQKHVDVLSVIEGRLGLKVKNWPNISQFVTIFSSCVSQQNDTTLTEEDIRTIRGNKTLIRILKAETRNALQH